jgi:hypothetical protein
MMVEETTMIVEEKTNKAIVNGMISESFFSVKQENLAHIFSILRNSLYSDKAGAIIREYSTNAYDAHIQAGINDTPISINCPTRFSPLLTIRDYGFGLSEEQIYNVYASYGESTKRNTNNQVGMMGLGSKSAFSYTDSFTVISHNAGIKKSYLAFIDDSGIGKIMKVNEESTEETGIEIQVPVKSLDCYMFDNAITKHLRYFNPLPNINSKYVKESIETNKPVVMFDGSKYQIIKSYDDNYVVMGNVAYPFNTSSIDKNPAFSDAVKNVLDSHMKVVLFAEIGDVVPSASRESLDMREKTVNWIGESIINIQSSLQDDIVARLDICDTIWDAKCFYNTLSSNHKRLVSGCLKEGYALREGYALLPADDVLCKQFTHDKLDNICQEIKCKPETRIYVNKGDVTKPSMKKRIIHDGHMTSLCYSVELLKNITFEEFCNLPEFFGATIIDFASIELPKIVRTRQAFAKINDAFVYNGGYNEKDSWDKVSVSLKHDEGVYLSINRYNTTYTCSQLRSIRSSLLEFGYDTTIHGVRNCDISKLGNDWTHLRYHINEILDNLSPFITNEVSKGFILYNMNQDTKILYQTFADLDDDPFEFRKIYDIETFNFDYSSWNAVRNLMNCGFKYNFDKEQQILDKLHGLKSKYPLIEHINLNSQSIPLVKEYIEAMNG